MARSGQHRSNSVRSKYHILGLVGRGQFGRVFCAIHKLTGQMVALKEVDPYSFPTAKFLRELRFLVTLEHKNVVSWQGYDHFEEGRYLVMDYCEGGNLRHLLNVRQRVEPELSLQIITEVLDGLAHAHESGIIHCDLKPENILLHVVPGKWQVRLSDFGIACMSHESSGKHDSMHGSPAYMAPERFYSEMTTASDVYAVGVIWFELLTGDRPFSGAPADLIQAHRQQTVQLPSDLPQELQAVLLKALDKNPQQRFVSAKEMFTAIAQLPTVQIALSRSQSAKSRQISLKLQPIRLQSAKATTNGLVNSPEKIWETPLEESIQHIFVRSTGYFLQTIKGLYHSAPKTPEEENLKHRNLEKIQAIKAPTLVAISDQGGWLATLESNRSLEYRLAISKIESQQVIHQTQLVLLTTPQHWVALDQRHLLLISHRPGFEDTDQPTTCWSIYNRRGNFVYEFYTPFDLHQIIKCSHSNNLLAVEVNLPDSLLVINYKPFQVRRIPLRIEAKRMASATWGYVVIDGYGTIELIDRWGQSLGKHQIQVNPSAIALQNDTTLLIATQQAGIHQIIQIDLQPLLKKPLCS